jgi:hypothetical protein
LKENFTVLFEENEEDEQLNAMNDSLLAGKISYLELQDFLDNYRSQSPKAVQEGQKVTENSSTTGVRYLGKDFKPQSNFKEKIFSFEVTDRTLCLKKIIEKVNKILVEEGFRKVSEQNILKENIGIFTQKNDNCYVIDKKAIIKVTTKKRLP